MLANDSLRSADGHTEATARRRLLHLAARVAATAPLAALTAGGVAQTWPETPAAAPRRIRRAVLVPRFVGNAHYRLVSNGVASTGRSRHQDKGGFAAARADR